MSLKKLLILITTYFLFGFTVFAQTEPGVYAQISTSKGTMVFRLDTTNTPATAANFIGLAEGFLYNEARSGVPYYDGLLFYRAIKKYAVFTGDPLNNGYGGPGYTIPREKNPSLSAENPGTLMMGGLTRVSHGSHIFIMVGSDKFLDDKYTPFGFIIQGMDVLNRITDDDTIESIKIIRIGEEALTFAINEESVLSIVKGVENNQLAEEKASQPELVQQIESLGTKRERSISGIWYLILREGNGNKVRSGQIAVVHYKGMLLNGTVFDSSYQRGQPLELAVGLQPMIPGWMEALMEMNEGEKRRIIIPPEMAYGKAGYGPIGPDSWLVFELELMDIK